MARNMTNDITIDDLVGWMEIDEYERDIDTARELLVDIANGAYSPEELRDEILQYKEDREHDLENGGHR